MSTTGWSPDTVHAIFSVTKMISAATTMLSIIEPGLATLDSTIGDLLPDIFVAGNPYVDATLRELMSHTSGIPYAVYNYTKCFQTLKALNNPFFMEVSNTSYEECVRQIATDTPPDGPPGTQFDYSDLNYEVLGLVIQRLTGLHYEDVFQKYMAGPLGMTSSTFVCKIAGSTFEHSHPAMGLCTTTNDFSKFNQLMNRKGVLPCGRRLLLESSVDTILTKQTRHASLSGGFFEIFTTKFFASPCVINTIPAGASNYGYGLGALRNLGFRFPAWYHGGALCAENWIIPSTNWFSEVRGRGYAKYSAFFDTAAPLDPHGGFGHVPVAITNAFEAENFPDDELCPNPAKKLSPAPYDPIRGFSGPGYAAFGAPPNEEPFVTPPWSGFT